MKNHRFPWLRNRTTEGPRLKKARNIKPFGVANRNRRPAFSPAFSSCVPGFSGGFPPRAAVLEALSFPLTSTHKCGCLFLTAPHPVPGGFSCRESDFVGHRKIFVNYFAYAYRYCNYRIPFCAYSYILPAGGGICGYALARNIFQIR